VNVSKPCRRLGNQSFNSPAPQFINLAIPRASDNRTSLGSSVEYPRRPRELAVAISLPAVQIGHYSPSESYLRPCAGQSHITTVDLLLPLLVGAPALGQLTGLAAFDFVGRLQLGVD